MATAIIILHWNNRELILKQLDEIKSWSVRDIRVYVVDNGRNLNLDEKDDRIHLIQPQMNMGYSGGCNLGIVQATKDQMSVCFLLNPDVQVSEEQFNRLLSCGDEHPDWYAWSPVIQEESMPRGAFHLGGRNPALYLNSRIASDTSEMKIPEVIDYLPGTALMCRTRLFDETGLLDERFFIGGEIADLFSNMKSRGLSYGICKNSILVHTREGNFEVRKYLHTYYNFRNRFLLIQKYHAKNAVFIRAMWRILLYRQIVGALLRLDFRKANVVRWALQDGLRSKYGKSSRKLI